MDFEPSPKARETRDRARRFIRERIAPVEGRYWRELAARGNGEDWTRWQVHPLVDELKAAAQAEGLWNLFLPDPVLGGGLSTLDYALVAEETGRSFLAPEVFNCSLPDALILMTSKRLASTLTSRSSARPGWLSV